jgi:hypothetical protein
MRVIVTYSCCSVAIEEDATGAQNHWKEREIKSHLWFIDTSISSCKVDHRPITQNTSVQCADD